MSLGAMCRGGVTNEGHERKSILRRSVRLPGAGLFRRTRAARSSQMRLVRVVGDSLPIATESRVEIWNARRRDTRFSSGIYSCVYVPRDALILSLSLSLVYICARARARIRFFTVSLPFCFPPVLAGGSTSSLSPSLRTPSCPVWNTNVRMHACAPVALSLSLDASASLVLSFFVLALPSARSRARGSDATRPSSAVAIASSLFSSASTSGAPAECSAAVFNCVLRDNDSDERNGG